MALILLADDEAPARDLVRRALEADGHLVETTESGTEALERLQPDPARFALLISDVNMPGMDGIALAQRARQISPKLKLILMSGLVEHLERVRALPGLDCLTLLKPFTLDQVRTAVRGAIAP